MKLKDYMDLVEPGTEITCWDKDVDSEFYFYVKETDDKLLYGENFPNVDKCMKRLTDILDVVKIHDTGVIEVNLYEKLEHPEVIRYAKENFYEKHQYEDDADVVMLLFDDNDKNISQGFEEFSRMMVECLDLAYGPESTLDIVNTNNKDLPVQFAVLWGVTMADARGNKEQYKHMQAYDSEELYTLFQTWSNEYLKGEFDDTVKFFTDKIEVLLLKPSLTDIIHAAETKSSLQSSEKSTPDIEPSR